MISDLRKQNSGTESPAGIEGRRVELLLGKIKGPLAGLAFVSFASNLLMLTGPLFMLQIYDRVLVSRSVPTLVALSILAAVLYLFLGFFEGVRSRMVVRFGSMIDARIGDRLLSAAVQLRLVPRASRADPLRDGDVLRQFISGAGPLAFLDLPWVPIYISVVFLFHSTLGWLAIAGALVIIGLLGLTEITSKRPSLESNAAGAARQRQSDEAVMNAEAIVAMGMIGAIASRWMQSSSQMLRSQMKAADRSSVFSSATKALRFMLQSAVLAVGAFLVLQDEMTAGVMIAASIITARALAPIEQVIGHWRAFVGSRQALKRIKLTLAERAKREPATAIPLPVSELTVDQLSTGPMGATSAIVKGVTMTLHAGDALGVLGRSGAGKSSLARALVGIWPTMQGEIRFDGAELRQFKHDQIGQIIGYLPQTVELFDGSVADNIVRFTAGATNESVLKAAMAANAHELITKLVNGYDTEIGTQGSTLSAGQRQRIGLARALWGDPFLVVLDEPNSNLDSVGDEALTKSIAELRKRGAVVVVVAHRPSAVAAVNKVIVLDDGRQIAFGPKDEVLGKLAESVGPSPAKVPS